MPPREGIDERVLGEEDLKQSTPAGRVVRADPGEGCSLESRDDRAAGRERGPVADPATGCWKHLCGPLVVPGVALAPGLPVLECHQAMHLAREAIGADPLAIAMF